MTPGFRKLVAVAVNTCKRLALRSGASLVTRYADMETVFTWIYRTNFWGNRESRSGVASTLDATSQVRIRLPELIGKYRVRTLLDVPCGDFNWMQHVVREIPSFDYIGGDIVSSLVDANTKAFGSERVKFLRMDMTKDRLPSADLILVRDCLFHFSFSDTQKFLNNLHQSTIEYILVTSFDTDASFHNEDIHSGDFRFIDLTKPPYGFPSIALEHLDDSRPGTKWKKVLLLYRVSDVPTVLGHTSGA